MAQKKRKYKFRIICIAAAFILLTTAAVVMILLGYTPGIYQPFVRPASGEVSPYLTHQVGPDFFTGMQNGKPFEMVFQQQGVNEMLALSIDLLPLGEMTLSSPSVVFYPGSVILMATAEIKGVSSVLSITAEPVINPDGRLNMNIRSATLGAVPVLGLVRRIVQQAADEYLTGQDQQYARLVNSILNNEPFEPAVSVSKYNMRLKALTLEEGKIRLLIEPAANPLSISGPKVP